MIASMLSHWNVTAAGLGGMIAVRRSLPVAVYTALDTGLDMVRTVVSNRLRLPTVKSWSCLLYLALILPQTGMSKMLLYLLLLCPMLAIQVLRIVFFWKFDTHPPPR